MRLCIELVINLIPKGPHSVWHKYCIHWRMARPCRAHNLFLTCRRDKTFSSELFFNQVVRLFFASENRNKKIASLLYLIFTLHHHSNERNETELYHHEWKKKKTKLYYTFHGVFLCVCVSFSLANDTTDERLTKRDQSLFCCFLFSSVRANIVQFISNKNVTLCVCAWFRAPLDSMTSAFTRDTSSFFFVCVCVSTSRVRERLRLIERECCICLFSCVCARVFVYVWLIWWANARITWCGFFSVRIRLVLSICDLCAHTAHILCQRTP